MNFVTDVINGNIVVEILKPSKGNAFNTNTIYGLGDYLQNISKNRNIKRIIIKGYVDRGLDIAQIMSNIDNDVLDQLVNDFEINSWRDNIKNNMYDLDQALTVLKVMLKGMFRLLYIIDDIHNKGIETIGICNNAIAGGAAIMTTCNKVIAGSEGTFSLPEIFFDIPVSDLSHFMIKKGINADIIKGYTMGIPFNSHNALKYGIIDKIEDNLDDIYHKIINDNYTFDYDICNNMENLNILDDIKSPLIEQDVLDYTFENINSHNGLNPHEIWDNSLEYIIDNVTEKSIIKLLYYIYLDGRFDKLRP